MSLITGNKVKKTHKPRYCEKEKDKDNKRILRSLSFDNNGNNIYIDTFTTYVQKKCSNKNDSREVIY
jgi:hypothetical protein